MYTVTEGREAEKAGRPGLQVRARYTAVPVTHSE